MATAEKCSRWKCSVTYFTYVQYLDYLKKCDEMFPIFAGIFHSHNFFLNYGINPGGMKHTWQQIKVQYKNIV